MSVNDKEKDVPELKESKGDSASIEGGKTTKNSFPSSLGKGPIIAIVSVIVVITTLLCIKIFNTKTSFVVKFDTDGGNKISSQTLKKNEKVKKPDDPVKEGHIFLGWYVKGKEYNFDSKVTKDLKLVAKWENKNKAPVTGITLDQIEMALLPNENVPLVATVEPADARNKNVIWESDKESVATVDEMGFVKTKKIGVAKITAKTEEGGFVATCTIVVSNDVIKVTGITLNENKLTVGIGDTQEVKATISPTNATNNGVMWESDDPKIATVNSLGEITGVDKGTTVITAKTKDGAYTAKVTVNVKKIVLKKIIIDDSKLSIGLGESKSIKYRLDPKNASPELVWKSGNDNIVSVDKKGIVTGLKEGSTTVIVSSKKEPDISASVTVKVSKPVPMTGIKLNKHEVTLYLGDKTKKGYLSATVLPTNTTDDKSFKWIPGDNSIVTISSGQLTAKSIGSTTISVKTNKGGFTDNCTVTVKEKYLYTVTQNGNKYELNVKKKSSDENVNVSNISGIDYTSEGGKIVFTEEQKAKLPSSFSATVNGETVTVFKG